MRAKNNAELQRTNTSRMLNCFDPNINIARLVDHDCLVLESVIVRLPRLTKLALLWTPA